MKRMRLMIIHAVTCVWWVGSLYAATPLGAPEGRLEAGQWELGLELAHGEADWEAQGQCIETVFGVGSLSYAQHFDIEDLETNAIFLQFAYGLTGQWDLFARVGGVQTEAESRVNGVGFSAGNAGRTRLDSSDGFAAGIGTRATFYRRDNFSLGGVLQGTWHEPGESHFRYQYTGGAQTETLVTDFKLKYFQTQVALAGQYEEDYWHVWLGPFLQHISGDLDLEAQYSINNVPAGLISCSADLDDSTQLGLTLGGGMAIRGCTYRLEGQFTGDNWLLGLSGTVVIE